MDLIKIFGRNFVYGGLIQNIWKKFCLWWFNLRSLFNVNRFNKKFIK